MVDETITVAEFGERYLREIVSKDRKDMTKKQGSFDAAAGALRGVLRRLFDYAVTHGLIAANPVLALPLRHVHNAKARDRALSEAEVSVFLEATRESNIRRQFKIAIQLILLSRVRKSELLLARWEHVDFDKAAWHIPAAHSKTGKSHVVYLSHQAVAHFKTLHVLACGSELVLPGRSSLTKPFAHNGINSALKVSLRGQDIPAFTIHDLRRTASTLLHEKGWLSDVVEKARNHSIGGIRGVYNRAEYEPQRRDMSQFWADHIDRLSPAARHSRGIWMA